MIGIRSSTPSWRSSFRSESPSMASNFSGVNRIIPIGSWSTLIIIHLSSIKPTKVPLDRSWINLAPPCGHLQTIYSAFADFSRVDLINYERRIIKVPDGGQIALDFTPPNRFSNKNDPTPTLIVLHGLTGGSHESYVRSLISPLTKEFGWRAVVTNFRGCAGSKLTSPKLYKFANHFFYHMISSVLLFHKKEKKVAQVYLWLDISLPVLLIHIWTS